MSAEEFKPPGSKSGESWLARWRGRLFSRVTLWLAGGLAALALIAGAWLTLWLYSIERAALPQLDGALRAEGLTAKVVVRRDAHGVPHIEAANQDDLFFAQGYVTAQDRLWQMDSLRRYANGELAEVLGPGQVEHDRTQRILGIRRTAERIYANLPVGERRRLEDYARGVNAFIAACRRSGRWPAEFKLLDYRPRPWTGADSVSVGLTEVQALDMHSADKLSRMRVREKLHNPVLERDLYPVGSWRDHAPTGTERDWNLPRPAWAPKKSGSDEDDEDDNTETRVTRQGGDAGWLALGRANCAGCAVGSNEWVVAGKHTASGMPLLSNDMHLQATEPNIWYMAALKAPGYDAAGVTLPGFPYVVAGHNEHVAWGYTALYADVQDLYLEKLDGHGHYQGDDGRWHPLAVNRETIHVRFGEDVTVDVESTQHGPLVNSIVHEKQPIALQWNLYDPKLNSIPLYAMNVAANWQQFSRALQDWCWPAQNLVYADDQGHIAYHAIGKVPIRPEGIEDVPIPYESGNKRPEWGAADAAGEFQSYIPFDQLPSAFDPPSGLLATANARVTTGTSPYPLTDEWMDPYRIERIYTALLGRSGLKASDMLALQTDVYSEVDQELAHRFAYAIDHTKGADARLREAAVLLRNWDGRLAVDSAAASIVDRAREALWPLILKPKLGKEWKLYHWGEQNFAEEEIIMRAKTAWLPPGYKDWNALLTAAVRRGMEKGDAPDDPGEWKYGDWHTIDVEHPLAAFLPWLARFAGTGAQPISGDTTTVKQIGKRVAPSQRFTIDWSNVDGATENIVMGESGDPLSPYYRDQWNAWYTGTTFALPFTDAAVARQTSHVLELLP